MTERNLGLNTHDGQVDSGSVHKRNPTDSSNHWSIQDFNLYFLLPFPFPRVFLSLPSSPAFPLPPITSHSTPINLRACMNTKLPSSSWLVRLRTIQNKALINLGSNILKSNLPGSSAGITKQ